MGKLSKSRKRAERQRIARNCGMSAHPNDVLGKTRKVLVYDPLIFEYPELYLDVYIVGDSHEQRQFAEMFARSRCSRADSPEEADIVVFTGGADVNPKLYGAEKHPNTHFSDNRDEVDLDVFAKCYDLGIPMFGVCRGAQFLHVMNGGKLYQHVDGHNAPHSMWDCHTNRVITRVSSVHHQMCIKNSSMQVLGTSHAAQKRWIDPHTVVEGSDADVEAFFYRETCSFGVQGHPEYADFQEFTLWTLHRMNEFFLENPDLYMTEKRVRRIKDDILEMRNAFNDGVPSVDEPTAEDISDLDSADDIEDKMIAAYGTINETENA